MTRLLVVHPDPLVLWDRAAALEHVGYDVETCPGPTDGDCPVRQDQACPLLDRADVLLYDTAVGSPHDMRLLAGHLRELYADLPLIVLGEGDGTETADAGDIRVWRVPSAGTVRDLSAVIEEALSEQGMAV